MFGTIINQEKAIKTFVFEKEQTQQSLIVDYELDLRLNFINLNYLLSIYCPPHQHRVSIYDPNANCFVSLDRIGAENGYVHKQYLEPNIILLRYRRNQPGMVDSDSVDSSLEHDSVQERRDGRSKERTIADVIEMVKKWRNLHLHGLKSLNRRLNLQDAAKLVGISKKSLDDYYCQLRLGEFYNFDFASKLNEKMGVLRSYVKDYKPEKDQKRRQNQKHPKNLRVIEQFELETKTLRIQPEQEEEEDMVVETSPQMVEKPTMRQEEPEELMLDSFPEMQGDSNQVFQELDKIEQDFFKGFELVLDDLSDPYMEIDRDFRKKEYEDQSNSFIYF